MLLLLLLLSLNLVRVQITDIAVGDGVVVEAGKGVVIKWVMRRSNGYYVSSSAEGDGEPFVYRVREWSVVVAVVASMLVSYRSIPVRDIHTGKYSTVHISPVHIISIVQ